MTGSLKERMRFFKLRTVHNAYAISTTFNKQFQPEIIPEQNDALQIDWIDRTSTEDVLVGDTVCIIFLVIYQLVSSHLRQNKALRIGNPEDAHYMVRYPIYNRNFNLRDYPSVRVVLSDLEVLIRRGLQEKCDLQQRDYKVCNERRTPIRTNLIPSTELFCYSGYPRSLRSSLRLRIPKFADIHGIQKILCSTSLFQFILDLYPLRPTNNRNL